MGFANGPADVQSHRDGVSPLSGRAATVRAAPSDFSAHTETIGIRDASPIINTCRVLTPLVPHSGGLVHVSSCSRISSGGLARAAGSLAVRACSANAADVWSPAVCYVSASRAVRVGAWLGAVVLTVKGGVTGRRVGSIDLRSARRAEGAVGERLQLRGQSLGLPAWSDA